MPEALGLSQGDVMGGCKHQISSVDHEGTI